MSGPIKEEPPASDADALAKADGFIERGDLGAARALLLPIEAAGGERWRDAVIRLATLDEQEGRGESAIARWQHLLAQDIDDERAWAHLRRLGSGTPARVRGPGQLGAMPTLDSPAGVSLGRFEIIEEIGRGTFATVYLAKDRALDLELALKVLHPLARGENAAVAERRFFGEARAAARLRHPGVVAIYALDEASRTLAMELVRGGTLRQRLRKQTDGGGLDPQELERLAEGLLAALAYVHRQGVVHGDLSPRNVLLREPGFPVLGDFGVAQLEDDRSLPADGGGAGTPLFLAPERLRGEPPTPAADLYAVGTILWQAAAGRAMRQHQDLVAGEHAVRPLPPETLRRLGSLGPRLSRLLEALLAPHPAARPANAQAALDLLGRHR